jgi:NAD(P)-dependent dehydrogenase (short-subunit alcohol dehydrogenase family)
LNFSRVYITLFSNKEGKMKDFAGKIAFITGGASGAGFGQAKVFSEAGMKVVIADIRQDHIDEAMAYFKAKKAPVHAIKLDITDRKAYTAAADEVEKVFGGPPDLLINTAGVNAFGPAEASTFEDFDWVIGVDLFGVINAMVIFVPRMIKAGKGGYIATVASMGGFMASSGCTPYSVAKAGVIMLMECYMQALKPYGIGVTCLCPGGIKSHIDESALTRPKSLANTGYNTDKKTMEFEHNIYMSVGVDPVDLAKMLKKAIEDEQFILIPAMGPGMDPARMLMGSLERFAYFCTPDGMKKYEEAQRKRFEEMSKNMPQRPNPYAGAAEAGWGAARKDLDWVKRPGRPGAPPPKKD